MTSHPELPERARRVIDANRYMALGTADEAGVAGRDPELGSGVDRSERVSID